MAAGSKIPREEIDAILGGYHGDPFAILGPHKLAGTDNWEVRAFLPQALMARVVIGNQAYAMTSADNTATTNSGFYVVSLTGEPQPYILEIKLWNEEWMQMEDVYRFPALSTNFDLHLHGEGTLFHGYDSFGAHPARLENHDGTRFTVWAPNAHTVSIAGDFNDWDTRRHPMRLREGGVWEIFMPGVGEGACYKYFIQSKEKGYSQLKCDPYGFAAEVSPRTGSVVANLDSYQWNDAGWMEKRAHTDLLLQPVSVYEVHIESWLKGPGNTWTTYRELAESLSTYVKKLGFTHVEFLPVAEHPFAGSWGYQVTGFFAPTSRFGGPADFMFLVDRLHQEGIGVILDWVPGHFPKDAHGLAYFDGTALYEHEDSRKGEHRDWGTLIFNYGRNEVRSFLISNALFWLKKYHIDGLRVDAVASMLYLDYSRKEGEWIPNEYGGRENLEAISFLQKFNEQAHTVPGAITIAEESTSYPGVSRPVYSGGLGFTMKWNMGWMHDMLKYFQQDPVYRKYNHQSITFSMLYAFSENFMLPISHDEVVHGKGSLIGKMPGDTWQKFANVRTFLAYMWGHPGKKLLFMGCEIGQFDEWNHNVGIQWDLLDYESHRGLQSCVTALNTLYRSEPALYEVDFSYQGFEWIDFRDTEASVITFLRRGKHASDHLVFICNFTPVVRHNYRVGVPEAVTYVEALNTDSNLFGGSNVGNGGFVVAHAEASHGQPASVWLTVPPLAVLVLKPMRT